LTASSDAAAVVVATAFLLAGLFAARWVALPLVLGLFGRRP